MKKVQEEIGMLQGISVSSVGKSGGLALLWKPDMNVSIRFLNRWYIDALVYSRGEIGVWRFTGFYGNPETHRRVKSWELIKQPMGVHWRF